MGTSGKLFMKNKRVFNFTVDSVEEGSYFSYTVSLPGATSKWYWELKGSEPTQLTMGVKLTGMLSWMYSYLLNSTLESAFKECTNNLVKMV